MWFQTRFVRTSRTTEMSSLSGSQRLTDSSRYKGIPRSSKKRSGETQRSFAAWWRTKRRSWYKQWEWQWHTQMRFLTLSEALPYGREWRGHDPWKKICQTVFCLAQRAELETSCAMYVPAGKVDHALTTVEFSFVSSVMTREFNGTLPTLVLYQWLVVLGESGESRIWSRLWVWWRQWCCRVARAALHWVACHGGVVQPLASGESNLAEMEEWHGGLCFFFFERGAFAAFCFSLGVLVRRVWTVKHGRNSVRRVAVCSFDVWPSCNQESVWVVFELLHSQSSSKRSDSELVFRTWRLLDRKWRISLGPRHHRASRPTCWTDDTCEAPLLCYWRADCNARWRLIRCHQKNYRCRCLISPFVLMTEPFY